MGIAGSGDIGSEGKGLYECAGGSAPDIAGQNIANPIAEILSAALMLRLSFHMTVEADAIEAAIVKVLDDGYRTGDIMTREASGSPAATWGMPYPRRSDCGPRCGLKREVPLCASNSLSHSIK